MKKNNKTNNQLRNYLPNRVFMKFKSFLYKIKGLNIHSSVYILSGAKILRYLENITFSNNVIIKSNAQICSCNKDAKIIIGENSTVGDYTFIYSSQRIEIGNDCMIAPFVYIVDSNHGTSLDSNMNVQPNETKPIKIQDNVWIGTHSIILPGVKIGSGAIIASGSVVNIDIPPNTICGGVPVKLLKKRK